MTKAALHFLETGPDGFFLMVEGARIDHASHINHLPRCVGEVLGFNRAVIAALHWAGDRDDVLILVTADHETGGLRVLQDRGAGLLPDVSWSAYGHTAVDVDLFGTGPGADLVPLVRDNTEIFRLVEDPGFPPPRLQTIARNGPEMVLSCETVRGRRYRVQWRPNAPGAGWQSILDFTGRLTGVQQEAVPVPGPSGQFRVVHER